MTSRVQRAGGVVRRPANFWTPAVHGLLRHLEALGFPAPRPLAVEGETEILTWIDGESGPDGWAKIVPEDGLRNWAAFLRRYHDAVAGYRPQEGTSWSSGPGTCAHGGSSATATSARGTASGAAGIPSASSTLTTPGPPRRSSTSPTHWNTPRRSETTANACAGCPTPEPPDRCRRIEIFCDAYGIPVPADITARVAWQQRLVLQNCRALASQGIEPQVTWVREGYLDTVRARINWTESLQIP